MDKLKYFGKKSDKAIAKMLGLNDLKSCKRGKIAYGIIPDCEEARDTIEKIAKKVGMTGKEDEFERLLFKLDSSLSTTDTGDGVN